MSASFRIWLLDKGQDGLLANSLLDRFKTGAFWSVAGGIFSRGSLLAASVGCARMLGTTGFGQFGMIQSTAGMFGIFAGLGLGITATKYVAEYRTKDRDRAGRILALSAIVALITGGLMTGALIAASRYLANKTLGLPSLAGPLAIASGLVMFGSLNGAQTGALAGLEAFHAIAQVNLWTGVGTLILVTCATWYGGLSGAVSGLVAAIALNWLLNNMAIRRECARAQISYQFPSCGKEWRVLYRFSLPAFLASIVVGPAMWVCNTLLVNRPNGYGDLGLYTAADKWRILVLFVPTTLAGMTLPLLSNLHGEGDSVGYGNISNASLLINVGLTIVPAAAIAVCAIPILSVYGSSYRAGWPILVVLALSAVPEALNTVFGYELISKGWIWWRLWFDLLLGATLVVSAWWAIPRWGAMGLAGSYCLAFSVVGTGLFLFLRHSSLETRAEITLV
jgi:O-antigen/teichoic acid export membrane protein